MCTSSCFERKMDEEGMCTSSPFRTLDGRRATGAETDVNKGEGGDLSPAGRCERAGVALCWRDANEGDLLLQAAVVETAETRARGDPLPAGVETDVNEENRRRNEGERGGSLLLTSKRR